MTEKSQRGAKTGEMAERARQAGVKNVEQMNKGQLQEAMSRGKSQQGRSEQPKRGEGRGQGQRSRG